MFQLSLAPLPRKNFRSLCSKPASRSESAPTGAELRGPARSGLAWTSASPKAKIRSPACPTRSKNAPRNAEALCPALLGLVWMRAANRAEIWTTRSRTWGNPETYGSAKRSAVPFCSRCPWCTSCTTCVSASASGSGKSKSLWKHVRRFFIPFLHIFKNQYNLLIQAILILSALIRTKNTMMDGKKFSWCLFWSVGCEC